VRTLENERSNKRVCEHYRIRHFKLENRVDAMENKIK
jgi:hypothetical protein